MLIDLANVLLNKGIFDHSLYFTYLENRICPVVNRVLKFLNNKNIACHYASKSDTATTL